MTRNLTVEAVVLAHRKTSGMHRRAVLLSPEAGMIEADAFGAKRGSLTGKIGQFISGTCVLYYNPVKKTWKIEDFSPREYRSYISSSLPLIYTASFFSECIMKTYAGGGEYPRLFDIMLNALDGLSQTERRDLVIIQFLWRYLMLSGFLGEPGVCASCGRGVKGSEAMILDPMDGVLNCSGCSTDKAQHVLSPGARSYLEHTLGRNFSEAMKVGLARSAAVQLKGLLVSLVDQVTEGSLKTLGSNMI